MCVCWSVLVYTCVCMCVPTRFDVSYVLCVCISMCQDCEGVCNLVYVCVCASVKLCVLGRAIACVTHTRTHTRTRTQTHTHMHTHSLYHTHTHTHRHNNTHTHKHTNTQTHKHTNTPTHKHTNTQTHKHTNTPTHTQTNTHTHRRPGPGAKEAAVYNTRQRRRYGTPFRVSPPVAHAAEPPLVCPPAMSFPAMSFPHVLPAPLVSPVHPYLHHLPHQPPLSLPSLAFHR